VTLEACRSVSEKLLDLSEFRFHQFEVFLGLLDVLRLERRLRLGGICLHSLLCRDDVPAKLQTLVALRAL